MDENRALKLYFVSDIPMGFSIEFISIDLIIIKHRMGRNAMVWLKFEPK